MVTPRQRIIAFGLWLELVALFAACLLGVSLMTMEDMNCVTVQQAVLCPMAVAQWMGDWQYFLAPAFITSTLMVLFMILFALVRQSVPWLFATVTSPPAGYLWRKLFEPLAALVNYLTQQFSQGILHPKIY